MFETNTIFASLIWGGIGSGFLVYGWKQKSTVPLGTGLAMVALSYFVASAVLMSVAESAILGLMFWLKKQGH